MMVDPLPDPMMVQANWQALAIFGRDRADPREKSRATLHGVPLCALSFVLLFADVSWLMTLKDHNA